MRRLPSPGRSASLPSGSRRSPRTSPSRASLAPAPLAAGAPGHACLPCCCSWRGETRHRRRWREAESRFGHRHRPPRAASLTWYVQRVDEALTEQVRTAMPYAATLGLELIAASKDEVHAAVEWNERLTTAAGILHGGVLMGLADTAGAFCAFLNLPEGSTSTATIESKTNFFSAVRSGRVEARSRPLHRGSRTIVVETDLFDESASTSPASPRRRPFSSRRQRRALHAKPWSRKKARSRRHAGRSPPRSGRRTPAPRADFPARPGEHPPRPTRRPSVHPATGGRSRESGPQPRQRRFARDL